MLRASARKTSNLIELPYRKEIVNDDGSMFGNTKSDRPPINGLYTLAGDLDVAEATVRAKLADKQELDAKFAELKELIRQTRSEMEQRIGVIKKVK